MPKKECFFRSQREYITGRASRPPGQCPTARGRSCGSGGGECEWWWPSWWKYQVLCKVTHAQISGRRRPGRGQRSRTLRATCLAARNCLWTRLYSALASHYCPTRNHTKTHRDRESIGLSECLRTQQCDLHGSARRMESVVF
jgi:hypothetical protein